MKAKRLLIGAMLLALPLTLTSCEKELSVKNYKDYLIANMSCSNKGSILFSGGKLTVTYTLLPKDAKYKFDNALFRFYIAIRYFKTLGGTDYIKPARNDISYRWSDLVEMRIDSANGGAAAYTVQRSYLVSDFKSEPSNLDDHKYGVAGYEVEVEYVSGRAIW